MHRSLPRNGLIRKRARKLIIEPLEVRAQFAADAISLDSIAELASYQDQQFEVDAFESTDLTAITVLSNWSARTFVPYNEVGLMLSENNQSFQPTSSDSTTFEVIQATSQHSSPFESFDSLFEDMDEFGATAPWADHNASGDVWGVTQLDEIASNSIASPTVMIDFEFSLQNNSELLTHIFTEPIDEFLVAIEIDPSSVSITPHSVTETNPQGIVVGESQLVFVEESSGRSDSELIGKPGVQVADAISSAAPKLVSLNKVGVNDKDAAVRENVTLQLSRLDPMVDESNAVQSQTPEFLLAESEPEVGSALFTFIQARRSQSIQASRSYQASPDNAVSFLANRYAALAAVSQNTGFIPDGMLAVGELLVGRNAYARPAKLDGVEGSFAMHGLFVVDDLTQAAGQPSVDQAVVSTEESTEPLSIDADTRRWWAPLLFIAVLFHASLSSQAKSQFYRIGTKIAKLRMSSKHVT